VEAILLLQLFDEMLPVCIDVYACFLCSTLDEYLALLYRVFRVFLQLGKDHYVKLSIYLMCVLEHWREHHPHLFEAYKENHRHTSEEEIELFHSTIRSYAEDQKTAARLSLLVNFHGASRGTTSAWMSAAGIRQASGGQCVDNYPEAVDGMQVAIEGLFDEVLHAASRCKPVPEEGNWFSPVLGTLADNLFPLSMQQNPEVYGFSGVCIRQHKASQAQVINVRTHFVCGHPRNGALECAECGKLVSTAAQKIAARLKF
jgi:hypothetical protein